MKKIVVVAFPGISIFHLSVPIAIFDDAVSQIGLEVDLKVCAEKSELMPTMNGIVMDIENDISLIDDADIIIFPSWEPNKLPSNQLVKKLISAQQRKKMIVGLCLGTYALAHAGLLNGKRATSHWKFSDDFKERFKAVCFESDPLFIEQENIITSAGTAAALDCCLYIVKKMYGSKVANKVARVMVSPPQRSGGQNQYIEQPVIKKPTDERIANLIMNIHENISESYSVEKAASLCSMSVRSFNRHFKSSNGMSFTAWLTSSRLNYALDLMETTSLSIFQIGEFSGFKSEQIFRKHFKNRMGTTPTAWRNQFRSK